MPQRQDADFLREILIADDEISDLEIKCYKTDPKVVVTWKETTTKRAEGHSLADVLRAIIEHKRPDVVEGDTQPLPIKSRSSVDSQTQKVKAVKDDG